MIYLDNAATSFPKVKSVCDIMDKVNRNLAVNAGRGSYKLANEATSIIEKTRINLASMIGVMQEDVFLLPSNTYAMNYIINGLNWDTTKVVYVTPFEHNAVMRPLHIKEVQGKARIKLIPFKSDFSLDEDNLKEMLAYEKPDYIFLNHASNVIGCMIPLKNIYDIVNKWNPIVIVDVAQTIGISDLRKVKNYADFLVFTGHKNLQGPLGIGGFIKTGNVDLAVTFAGGNGSDSLNLEMPAIGNLRYEIGSPNISSIAGLNEGINWLKSIGVENIAKHKKELLSDLIKGLENLDNVILFKPKQDDYIMGILSFVVIGYESTDVGKILDDEFDIAVRTGHHCAPLVHKVIDDLKYGGTVRVSVGYFNTHDEIAKFIEAIRSL